MSFSNNKRPAFLFQIAMELVTEGRLGTARPYLHAGKPFSMSQGFPRPAITDFDSRESILLFAICVILRLSIIVIITWFGHA